MDRIATIATIADARHAYDVEVSSNGDYVRINANNRDQAARIAENAGYEARSVNMIG